MEPFARMMPYADRDSMPGRHTMKPQSRLWTSTYQPEGEYISDWVRWCTHEEIGWVGTIATVIEVAPAAIFTINCMADLERFMERAVPDDTFKGSAMHMNVSAPSDYNVNWTETVRAWDATALRVTEEGFWSTRMNFDAAHKFSTYTWDCESTGWVEAPFVLAHYEVEFETPWVVGD